MKKKLLFYLIIAILVVLDSVLITSPNLLGKVGLFIYKYYYLRTFPRALFTVSMVVLIAAALTEIIHLLVRRQIMKRAVGYGVLIIMLLLSVAILIKTNVDFSTWTYGHTGTRFKYGAYLLSVLLITIFGFGLFTLPKPALPAWPASSSIEEKKKVD